MKDLFEEASTLDDAAQRLFLDGVCGNDGELRAEVVSLLSAHSTADLDQIDALIMARRYCAMRRSNIFPHQ